MRNEQDAVLAPFRRYLVFESFHSVVDRLDRQPS